MKLTILVPAHTQGFNAEILEACSGFSAPDTELTVVDIAQGTKYIEGRWDIAVNTPYVIEAALAIEKGGADGIFVTDFDFCGVEAVRECVNIPVIGANRASSFTAMMLSMKFSIITITESIVALQYEHVRNWGILPNLASIKPTDLSVDQLKHRPLVIEKVTKLALEAIKNDGAESIILGCTGFVGIAAKVHEALKTAGYNVPVMDPNGVAINYLELLVRGGYTQSRVTYAFPSNFDPSLLPVPPSGNTTVKAPSIRELDKRDLEHLNNGAAFFASGGGGSVFFTRKIINKIISLNKKITLIPVSEMPDSGMMAICGIIGSPDKEEDDKNLFIYGAQRAWDLLSTTTGVDLEYCIPIETGSISVMIPAMISALKGIPIVDAAGSYRSIPKLSETTFAAYNVSPSPTTLASDLKDDNEAVKVVLYEKDAEKLDDLCRNIISANDFDQAAGIADFLMSGKQMQQAAVHNAVSNAISLGEQLAKEKAKTSPDPYAVINAFLKGLGNKSWLFTKGTVKDISEASKGGFDLNTVTIEGNDGQIFYVNSQNENLITWKDGQDAPIAMAPDLVSYVTPDCQPLSNADLKVGIEVLLIGSMADQKTRNTFIVNEFLSTLKTLGYYGPYVPIEKLNA